MSVVERDASAQSAGGGPVVLRRLREDDIPQVLAIEEASFSTPWRDSTFRGLMRRMDSDLFAAERGGRLLGYAVAWTVVDQSELGTVAVAPDARGAGIGGMLVDAVVERVRTRGARELFLEVRETNLEAQTLYRARGFAEVGRRRAYYQKPTEDALVMRLPLSESEHS